MKGDTGRDGLPASPLFPAGAQTRGGPPWQRAARAAAPWLLLAAFLLWGWRGQDFGRSVPTYGDILEFTWALTHYDQTLQAGANPLFAPNAFFPGGWDLTTYGQGFVFLPLLLPLHRLGGAAFAYNVAVLLTFVIAFSGAYALGRRWLGTLAAAVFAILVSFWGLRWFQTIGHINVLWGAALMPWIVWCLERGLDAGHRSAARGRAAAWFALAGALWAASVTGSLYFVWINGLLVAGWLLGCKLSGRDSWWQVVTGLAVAAAVTLALGAPIILATARATESAGARFYLFSDLSFWSASLNSLPVPYINHPWLSGVARAIYRGIDFENGAANFGLAASIAAAIAALAAIRRRRPPGPRGPSELDRLPWWPAATVAALGLILTLGVTLQWNSAVLRIAALEPVNQLLWQLGHAVKPDVFSAAPPPPYDQAIPLPGFLLTVVVPFFERARVFARYGFVASIGLFLLAAFAISAARPGLLRWALAAILIFEVIPPPLPSLPYPPAPHPAFEWLKEQEFDGEGALDLVAAHPDVVVPVNRGESVWAALIHGKPTVAGASSVWPAHASFLHDWLAVRPHALGDPQLAPMLRFYKARYLLLHMSGEWEARIRDEAMGNPDLEFQECFEPPAGPGPWPNPICVFEVLPSATPSVNLALTEGWSKPETWGVWAEGSKSRALWVTAASGPAQLALEAFPNCLPDVPQKLTVTVNGAVVAERSWTDCEPWVASIPLPEELVRQGANEVVFTPAYAQAPPGDTRPLSVGFSRLQIQ